MHRQRWTVICILSALVAAILLATTRGAALHAQGQPSGIQPGVTEGGVAQGGVTNAEISAGLTIDDYGKKLAEAIRMLEASPTLQTLQQVRQTLTDADAVQLQTGEWILVQPLLDGVRTPESAIHLLRATVAQMELASTDQPDERAARMAAILGRSEFRMGETLLDRLLRWLQRWYTQIAPEPQQTAAPTPWLDGASRTLSDGLIVTAGALLIIAIAWWLTRFLRAFVPNRRVDAPTTDDALPATAAQARVLANRQAREGSYRDAVRSLYLSALLELEEARLIPADRTYTNRELLARMHEHRARPALQSALAPVVDTFERIWYGIREPDKQAFDGYHDTIDRLRADVATQSSAAGAAQSPAAGAAQARSGEEASSQT